MALGKTGICDFGRKARDFKLKGVDGKSYARAEGHGRRFHLQPLSVCEGEHRSNSGGGQGDAQYRHRHDRDHAQ